MTVCPSSKKCGGMTSPHWTPLLRHKHLLELFLQQPGRPREPEIIFAVDLRVNKKNFSSERILIRSASANTLSNRGSSVVFLIFM